MNCAKKKKIVFITGSITTKKRFFKQYNFIYVLKKNMITFNRR